MTNLGPILDFVVADGGGRDQNEAAPRGMDPGCRPMSSSMI